MDAKNSNGFHSVAKEGPCSVIVKTPPQLNGHALKEPAFDKAKIVETNSEDGVDIERKKERDKKQPIDIKKDAAKCTLMDQDLEFYPIDEFNSSPSTFTAWDAFMTTNQAFFREPPCYSADYAVTDTFAYMDVIPEEDDLSVMESDTDDTGSSVSTVIDKFSRTSTANSSFSERIPTVKDDAPVVVFDLEQVLSPFEQLEKELDGGDEMCDDIVVPSGPVVVVTPITNGDSEEKECVKIQDSVNDVTIKVSDNVKPLNNCVIKAQNDEDMKCPSLDVDCRQIIRISNNRDTAAIVEKPRNKEPQSPSKIYKRGNIPEKPSITVTPPLPNKPPTKSSPKSKKEPIDKISPQISSPPKKKESSYPTPTVPPRMSKHLPARRTRSDPGSTEPSTPSRIPRPTYAIKATSEKSPQISSGSPRSGHTPRTKVSSPKITNNKKARSLDLSKAPEESGKNITSLTQPQPGGLECQDNAIVISIKSFADDNVSNVEKLVDPKFPKESKSKIPCPSDDNATKIIPPHCILPKQKFEMEKEEQSKNPNPEITNDLPEELSVPDDALKRNEAARDNVSEESDGQTSSPNEDKVGNSKQIDAIVLTAADQHPQQMSFPEIEIAQNNQQTVVDQNDREQDVVETNPQERISKPLEQQLVRDVEDMLLKNNVGIAQVKDFSQKNDLALDFNMNGFLLSSEDECNPKNHVNSQINIMSDNANDCKQSGLNNSPTADLTKHVSTFITEQNHSTHMEHSKIENLETNVSSVTQEQNSDHLQQQRPIRDILQALDNLCLSAVPKEVEINIDWNNDSDVNIKQKILPTSAGTPQPGSTDPSEDDSIETEMTKNSEQYIATFMQEVNETSNLVGESQQTTQYQELLPDSDSIAAFKSSSALPEPKPRNPVEKDEIEKICCQTFPSTVEEKDIALALKKGENEPPEDRRQGDHADSKGHCRCEKGQRPSRSSDSQSFDVIPDDFTMDMLNKFEKKDLSHEGKFVDCNSYPSRPYNSSEFQQVYASGIVYLPLGNENSLSGEVEDPSSTRHSSGCDDSGVFLEDLPYTPENTTANATVITTVDSGIEHVEKFEERKQLSPDMRQYSIDPQSLDSDAEKSDDLGLASSSVDSADDLDGDPLPSRLKIEPPSQISKKPPPVPPRKSISSGQYISQKELILTTNGISCATTDSTTSTPLVYSVSNIENNINPSEVFIPATKKHPDELKWKSEECLRPTTEARWLPKKDLKSVSVKDRIAMFSELETTTGAGASKTAPVLQRYSNENHVNSTPSEEIAETKCQSLTTKSTSPEDFISLSRDTKWYSMYSLPLTSPTSPLESKMDVGEPKITSSMSSSVASPILQENVCLPPHTDTINDVPTLKVDTEHFQRCSEKPIISSYPKTQLANNKRYNYGRYSLNPIRTTDDLLSKKNVGLLSIIDSRRQPLVKLKGLVIPDKPQQNSTNKALPTIVSNDSVILNSKTDADIEKDTKRSMLSATSYKTMSLPRTRNEMKAKLEPVNYDISKLMSEAPWKSYVGDKSTVLPKYSPAFKARNTLDLPNAVTSSLSPTPPSSITSPLSPPPSSPSSICSSNASSATSVATMQQNIFQFSLSHSKPVTPVLPEKPIMSPPSLPSDIEYEGDNSEDSSTSASPMTAKLISTSSYGRQLGTSRFEKSSEFSKDADIYSNGHSLSDNEKSQNYKMSRAFSVDSKINNSYSLEKSYNSDRQARQQYLSSVNRNDSLDYKSNDRYQDPRQSLENGKPVYVESHKHDSLPTPTVTSDTVDACTGRKNVFSATSQDVQAIKYRAQPLGLNQVVKNGASENETTNNVVKESTINMLSNDDSSKKDDNIRNGCGISHNKSNKDELKNSMPEYGFDKNPWSRSADLMRFKKSKLDSEDEDDSHSSLSHRTEDSRPTTDDYFSDATTDSFDKSLDPDLKPRRLSQQKVVLKATVEDTDSVQKFKALAEKWEQRTDAKSPPPPPPPLIPAPRKEQRPYAGSVPATSSFLSSVINSTSSSLVSNGNNYTTPISASLKLPPSLMPRNKHSSSQNDGKNNIQSNRSSQLTTGNERKYSLLSSEKDFKSPYESVWVDDRSRRSSVSGSRDVSDSGSGTDTSSSFSKKVPMEIEAQMQPNDTLRETSANNNGHIERKDSMSSKEVIKSRKTDFGDLVPEVDNSKERKQINSNSLLYNFPILPEREKKRGSIGQTDTCTVSTIHKLNGTEDSRITTPNGSADHPSTRGHSGTKTQSDSSWRSESNLDLTTRRNSNREFQSSDFLIARSLSKSQASLRDPLESVRSQASSYFSRNAKSVSVSDIRKAFEYQTIQNQNLASKPPPLPPRNSDTCANTVYKRNSTHSLTTVCPDHKRLSSLDSTASGDSGQVSPVRYGSVGSLTSISKDMYGSVTSLASTTSLISPQELQQLIDEANLSIDEESKDSPNQEIQVIVLKREVPSGSIGITLAGGADYEIKEITVHKVISGSLADRDGRLKKGDKVISINGKPLKGTTHREALDILKAPRPEVILVISREKEEHNRHSNGVNHNHHNGEAKITNTQPSIARTKDYIRQRKGGSSFTTNGSFEETSTANIVCVHLQKDVTGLGFSIEGGKDSPHGDRPLLIKRIFKGGVADKEGKLQVGDEIISVNGQSVTSMTRTEAWNFLKKLPEEPILLRTRKQLTCTS